MRLIVLLLCFSSVARADNFDRGLKSYRHSDFGAAERAFLKVLQEGVNRATRAKVYKYIGLSQYMLGRKADAGNSFRSALRFDPLTELYPNEALDSSVLEFFLQIKQENRRKAPTTSKLPRRPPVRKPLAKKKPYVPRIPMTGGQRATVRGKPTTRQSPAKRVVTKRPPTKTPTTRQRKSTDNLFGTKKPKKITFGSKKNRQPTTGDNRRSNNLMLPSNKKLSAGSGGGITALHFMPFGIGQFVNDSRWGFPLLVGQIGALGCASLMYMVAIDRENDPGYTGVKEAPNKTVAEKDYIEKYEAYANEPKIISYICAGGFATLWIGGMIEAIINRPLSEKYGALIPELHYHPGDSSVTLAWRIPW